MDDLQLAAIDKNDSYSQKVYKQLKYLILSNKIKSGQSLNERALVNQLLVSRTPIRDALKLLEQEGWIVKKGKTKVVSLLTWKMVRDLMEMREPLELISYDLAVKRITDKDIENLERITFDIAKIAEHTSDDNYFEAMEKDTEFHLQIARITGNQHIINIIADLSDQMIRTSILSVRYGDLELMSYAENHLQIIKYLKNHDYEAGRLELINHIAIWKHHLQNIPGIHSPENEGDLVF